MYEPYPHTISKAKSVILIVTILILVIAFIGLKLNQYTIKLSPELILAFRYIEYLILFALILFCFKTFLLLFSREYLYLFGGIFSFFILQLFYESFLAKSFQQDTIYFANISFELIAEFIFISFFLFAIFSNGKIIAAKNRRKFSFWIVGISIAVTIIISTCFFYILSHYLQTPKFRSLFLNLMKIINWHYC